MIRSVKSTLIAGSVAGTVVLAGSMTGVAANATNAATSTTHSGKVQVWVTPGKGAVDRILITGAIGDYGKAVSHTKSGRVTSHGNFVTVKLQHGKFEVDATKLGRRGSQTQPTIDRASCSLYVEFSGPVTLSGGTGAYAGITGKVRMRLAYAELGPRFASGPRKGKCNLHSDARPIAFFQSTLSGRGTISL
jgi:hypothetical protein